MKTIIVPHSSKKEIVDYFKISNRNIFKYREIEKLLMVNHFNWRLAANVTVKKFIHYLLEKTKLEKIELTFPGRKETRYIWSKTNVFNLALSIKGGSYLSHFSALFLHNLTEQIPKTIFINKEQTPKPIPKGELQQENINRAFKNKQRKSNYMAEYEDYRICILNGKYTNNLGVIEANNDDYGTLWLTDIERTLIDITVRPFYAGNVSSVLDAYKAAHGKISVNRLLAYLKKINYIYPYHQTIGFYLEKAGYSSEQMDLLNKFDIEYDFYLTYKMEKPSYSKRWRLFYPKDF